MTSHDWHDVSNHRQWTVCSSRYTDWRQINHQRSTFLALCEMNPLEIGGVTSQNVIRIQKILPCHDVITWLINDTSTNKVTHWNDVIMSSIASKITSLMFVYPTVYSGADQRKHQSSASLAFVREIHRSPVNSPHKGPVTRKCFHLMTSSCFLESAPHRFSTAHIHHDLGVCKYCKSSYSPSAVLESASCSICFY